MSRRLGSPRQPALTCRRGARAAYAPGLPLGVPAPPGISCRATGVHRGRPPGAPVWCQRSRGGERERIVPRKTENAERSAFRPPTRPADPRRDAPAGSGTEDGTERSAQFSLRPGHGRRGRLRVGRYPSRTERIAAATWEASPPSWVAQRVSRSTVTRFCSSGFPRLPDGSGRSTRHRRHTPRRPGPRPGHRDSPGPRTAPAGDSHLPPFASGGTIASSSCPSGCA